MKERPVDLERAVIAHDQAPSSPQPADGAFDDPATPIPSQCTTVLRRRANAILLVRADQFDPALAQPLSPRITVVGFVRNRSRWLLPWTAALTLLGRLGEQGRDLLPLRFGQQGTG